MKQHNSSSVKLRYLFVTRDGFPPYRVDVAILFAQKLVDKGHVIDWILPAREPCSTGYSDVWKGGRAWVGANDLGTSLLRKIRHHARLFKNEVKIFTLARKNRYDFILVKDRFLAAVFGLLAARMYHTRFFHWLSYPYPEEAAVSAGKSSGVRRLLFQLKAWLLGTVLYRFSCRFADHVFVQSDAMKKHFIGNGVDERKLTPVPMGISLDDMRASARRARQVENLHHHTVVYVGTLNHTRHIGFVLRTWHLVLQELSEARLYMVGGSPDPADEEKLWEEAKRLGISEKVVFTGMVPIQEAWEWIRRADLCVSYFHPDGVLDMSSPTKVVEYMAMGRPVVANDQPEQSHILGKSGGGICTPNDERAFAEAVIELLRNPDKARQMGAAGHRYVARHREYTILAGMVEMKFLEILQSNRVPRAG